MNANSKRILTVAGAVMTALAIALSMLAFLTVTTRAATGTGMPAMTDIIPAADGTSSLPFPEAGNVDTDDVVTPDDSTRTPVTILPEPTTRPAATSSPTSTSAPDGTGTDTGMLEEEGGSILGAVIAVIVVVAVILVVIALMPRKKR